LESPLTLSRLAHVRRGAFSIILVRNQIADYSLKLRDREWQCSVRRVVLR
jgi:hypothetical protein